jgi:predicted nucleic acid-binding protein
MMRKRVYIETTIPSFYYTDRTDPEALARINWTHRWWSSYAPDFVLTSSAAVIAELRRGKGPHAQARIDLLNDMELLPITDDVERIVQIYIQALVMPKQPAGDALHLALACYHRVDVLLTWNCIHLANANKIDRIRLINYEIGLPTPLLTTPLNYLSGEEGA